MSMRNVLGAAILVQRQDHYALIPHLENDGLGIIQYGSTSYH